MNKPFSPAGKMLTREFRSVVSQIEDRFSRIDLSDTVLRLRDPSRYEDVAMRAGLSLGVSLACIAGVVWSLLPATLPPSSALTADIVAQDLGPLRQGATASTAFRLRNSCDTSIVITRVAPSCGCTAAVVGNDRLRPGESTDLKVDFRAGDARGRRITNIDVGYRLSAEGPGNSKAVATERPLETLALELSADIVAHYEAQPAALSFGPDDRERRVRLTTNFEPDLTIRSASCPHPAFNVEMRPAGEDGSTRAVIVRFDPSRWQDGPLRPRLTLETSSPYQARHEVGITVLPSVSDVTVEGSGDAGQLISSDGH